MIRDLETFYGKRIDPLLEEVFPGGFLNFGYWDNIDLRQEINISKRIESQKELYRQAFDSLHITHHDVLLEVGCGRGRGAAMALDEYAPLEVHGVDAVERQVNIATDSNLQATSDNGDRLIFQKGTAESLPYRNTNFDKVLSIEATPHFSGLQGFVAELSRVTKRPGKVAIASIFSTTRNVELEQWIQVLTKDEVPPDVIHAHPVSEMVDLLLQSNVSAVTVKSIGKHVWSGFDTYLSKLGVPQTSRRRKWLDAYHQKLLDYYLITADFLPENI